MTVLAGIIGAWLACNAIPGAAAEPLSPPPPQHHVRHPLSERTFQAADIGTGYIRFPVHGFDRDPPPTTHNDDEVLASLLRLKARGGPIPPHPHSRRQGPPPTEVSLSNLQTGTIYSIDLGLGTPAQPVEVIIDTGSSELWVNPDCATAGTSSSRVFCNQFPKYVVAESSTFQDAKARNFIQYGKGNVTMRYVADSVTFGLNTTIKNQIFGVATESNEIPMGILGLGPRISAKAVQYPYVLDSLAEQKLIGSRAFSLDLRSVDDPNGAVVFGGVDRGKYIGSLEKCKILDPADTPRGADRYYINMNALSVNKSDGSPLINAYTPTAPLSTSAGTAVFLDTGGTLTRLPSAMFKALGDAFPGAFFDSRSGYYIVDCDVGRNGHFEGGTVDFGFASKTIRVSFADIIWRASPSACVLGVLPEDREPILGASFLRAAYVVYDQDNRNLHLAQAASCESDVVPIASGPDAVPSVTGRCTATPVATGAGQATATGDGASGPHDDPFTVTVGVGPTQTGGAVPSSTPSGESGALGRIGVGWSGWCILMACAAAAVLS